MGSIFAAFCAGIVRSLYACIFRRERRTALRWGRRFFTAASVLWLLYAALCGVNYYSTSFAAREGLLTGQQTPEQLLGLCEYLVEQIRAEVPSEGEPADIRGQSEEVPPPDARWLTEAGRAGQAAMEKLGGRYPDLAGRYPFPKPLLIPRILTVQNVTGVYSPFTVEANYNREIPYYSIPFTICHELSHLRGFMREDEANFIAFLACIGADSAAFRRSGYVMGWVYAGNALAGADPAAFRRLYGSLDEETRKDLAFNNRFWDRFDGTAAEVHEKVNDTYLKANGQREGTRSYGRVVDLMIAWYMREREER